ncbi:MAG: type II toxin-antitoxin system VapC family toxin [Thermoplasmataceae archaeon]
MILLDTDVIIEILDKKSSIGETLFQKIIENDSGYCTSSLNFHEILYGLNKYAKQNNMVEHIPIIAYTKEDSKLSSILEIEAERKGTTVPRMDTMIASVAINNGCMLYSLDKHFKILENFGLKLFE